jgi:AcrR family transcriptional regulator
VLSGCSSARSGRAPDLIQSWSFDTPYITIQIKLKYVVNCSTLRIGLPRRLTRAESKARTRAELLSAAEDVFLRRGFHAPSLDEIAEEAGYTRGAVYSNFGGKDNLFLAVLADHYSVRVRQFEALVLDQADAEGAHRAIGRFLAESYVREPRWPQLLVEFLTHAARDDVLRRAAFAVEERFFDGIAGVIEEVGRRHGLTYRLPLRDVARGSVWLRRGMAVEAQLDSGLANPEIFVEMFMGYMRGLAVPPTERSGQ